MLVNVDDHMENAVGSSLRWHLRLEGQLQLKEIPMHHEMHSVNNTVRHEQGGGS